MKACTKCGEKYPVEHFNKKGSGRATRCKKCVAEYYRNYYHGSEERKLYVRAATKANADKNKIKYRANKYGIDEKTLIRIIDRYDGMCWICRKKPWEHVDHDHKCCATQKACGQCVRGVLCLSCNHALGNMRDDIDSIRNMVEYLTVVYPHSDKV